MGSQADTVRFITGDEVSRRLTYDLCLPIVRDAMVAFSRGETIQLLRSMLPLSEGRMLGVMPGAMGAHAAFGAKLISVFHGNFARRLPSHQGVIVLFDPESGRTLCIVDAGEVTARRTAAVSAVATDALARKDAACMAILGYGEQAATHLRAISKVRRLETVRVWGRHLESAKSFAGTMQKELRIAVEPAADVAAAVKDADIVCTVTAAHDPVLEGRWLAVGTHVNVVGSGDAGSAEVDSDLVVRSRFFVDSREGVLRQGGEFLRAKRAGLIDDTHILAEIGQVLAGDAAGRTSDKDITVFKSLGHVVQDLACAWALYSYTDQL